MPRLKVKTVHVNIVNDYKHTFYFHFNENKDIVISILLQGNVRQSSYVTHMEGMKRILYT